MDYLIEDLELVHILAHIKLAIALRFTNWMIVDAYDMSLSFNAFTPVQSLPNGSDIVPFRADLLSLILLLLKK